MTNRTGKSYRFSMSACFTFHWTEQEAERTSWKRSSVSRSEVGNQRDKHRNCDGCCQSRSDQGKERARTFCLGRTERNCGCTMEADAKSTAIWRRIASNRVRHCNKRWRGPIASASSGAWRTKAEFSAHASVQMCKSRSTERLTFPRMRRDLDGGRCEDSHNSVQRNTS